MKIRNGFVSNSSSSSFVLLLPDNFLEKVDYDKIVKENQFNDEPDDDERFPLEDFKKLLTSFVNQGGMWNEEIYDYDTGDWEFGEILYDLMQPYVLTSLEAGPDAGVWTILDRTEVVKFLNKEV